MQFHFHSPSEHTINGKDFDAEVHFVHRNEDNPDELLVIGVLLDTDSAHWKSADSFFGHFKFDEWSVWTKREETENLKINIKKFLEKIEDKHFFHYDGSLTTPPCTEGVKWYVMREVQWINPDDLSFLQYVFERETN